MCVRVCFSSCIGVKVRLAAGAVHVSCLLWMHHLFRKLLSHGAPRSNCDFCRIRVIFTATKLPHVMPVITGGGVGSVVPVTELVAAKL